MPMCNPLLLTSANYGTRGKVRGVGERANWLSEAVPFSAFPALGDFTVAGVDPRMARRGTLFVSARQGTPLKTLLIILLLCVSGCSLFHRKPHLPEPSELIVTGAPVGSVVFVDGVQAAQPKEVANRPQEVEVTPGTH